MAETTGRVITLVNSSCDVQHAYNFNGSQEAGVGFIQKMSFTVSGTSLEADTPVSNPESPSAKLNVIAVLDSIKWEGGPTDPIEMRGRVSPKNRGLLLECLSSLDGGIDVEASWVVYAYDHTPPAKYYKHFHTDGKAVKLVLTKGFRAFVENTPSRDVAQPINYQFEISFTPKSKGGDQTLNYAPSATQKFARPIGINVA